MRKSISHFVSVLTPKWPEELRPLLLQSVLIGKAESVYASLSVTQSSNYKTVKDAVLRAREVVPEAYRQQFRKFKKEENQTRVEFAREEQVLFERRCKSQDAKDLDDLKNLILLEQFKRHVHERVATYLNEHKCLTMEKAASQPSHQSHQALTPNTMPRNPQPTLNQGRAQLGRQPLKVK